MFYNQQNKDFSYQLYSFKSQNNELVPITLKGIQYQCQIVNNILKTNLTQRFINESNSYYSDSIYYFPIEQDTCLQSFQAKYDNKIVNAVVKEKMDALDEYQQNKNSGNLVLYAENQKIQNEQYCKIQLGNLQPNQQVEIIITFSSQINCMLNKYYVARIPLQYCEDEISVKTSKNLLTLDLFCTGRITYAESRGLQTEKLIIDENITKFNLKQASASKDIDFFELVFQFEGMFEPQIIFGNTRLFNEEQVKKEILGERHSVLISFIPNFNKDISCEIDDSIKAAISSEKDIFSDEFQETVNQELVDYLSLSKSEFIFLLDRSASMEGLPIKRACEALILFLKSLPNDSYFNVLSFGSEFEMLFPSSRKYNNQNLEIAIKIISNYTANLLGTEIYNPLSCIYTKKRIQKYNRQIFLLTDGHVSNRDEVLNLIKKNNQFDRVHTIGFGSDADKYLVNKSAFYGKGISRIVDFKSDLSRIVLQMLCQSLTPIFIDLKIIYDTSIIESTYPCSNNLPFVIKDEIVNIHLFFKPGVDISDLNDEQKKIIIEYYDSCQDKIIQKELSLVIQDSFNSNFELQEAVFKIGKQLFLNEKMVQRKRIDNKQLFLNDERTQSRQIDEYIQQSIDYQILTQETALICVVETLDDQQKAKYQDLFYEQNGIPRIPPAPPLFAQNNQLPEPIIYVTSKAPPPPPLPLHFIQNNIPLPIITQPFQQKNPPVVSLYLSPDAPNSPPLSLPLINKTLPVFLNQILPPPPPAFLNQMLPPPPLGLLLNNQQSLVAQQPTHPQIFIENYKFQNYIPQCQTNSNNFVSQNCKIQYIENQDQPEEYPCEKEYNNFQNMQLEDFLRLADSQGVWKFNEILINQSLGLEKNIYEQMCSQFLTNDALMTLLMIIILEIKFSDQKPKWLLISKKAVIFIKSQIKQQYDLQTLKQRIIQQVVQQ
ncbi:type A von willebrand factor domain protein (macronuclear) [Tetrahymena thermophila SB210]|uniref:Type A von willebrand factor domain protein n=1 Tax=Tetrahymena thermophila (strain SB210) TaxID=312017 RepID=I7MJD2_TETTS|nr:type A von willebrand factor domain protein [Tetrahymena thermophila SB210]EAR96204.1 type A von willebrand factor domain protein [Tetrahymena thermophila SB210]|eukprot:XP_001016449.1 type A von willebrand factor domain protein [Tetrahymena thermophila SB210]